MKPPARSFPVRSRKPSRSPATPVALVTLAAIASLVAWAHLSDFAAPLTATAASPATTAASPATADSQGPVGPAEPDIDLTVPIPSGETPLAEIGLYRVLWQSYGKDPVEMPLSWAGHFDAATGISWMPWGKVLGRDAILIHSPWHVPPGQVWVEYRLALPRETPIALSFGIAMGPDVAVPDRSDGVTFSAAIVAGGKEKSLLREHHDRGEWRDFRFELSEHAGTTVTLRLAAEPGPKNNASFDYSFFGDAKVVAGTRCGDLCQQAFDPRELNGQFGDVFA